ncbi:hypothetical protein JTB14_030446 [Gonioctena quinquepunctata]|nr:hypothetical protein JTB14_030446 [Gonioctena quinquepunctata]
MSEIVKLQSQSWTGSLKHQELSENVEGMNLNDKSQPNFVHNTFNHTENTLEPSLSNIIYDKNVPIYNNDSTGLLPGAQFAGNLGPQKYRSNTSNIPNDTPFDPTIDIKYLQNPNFNPKNRPSQFMPQNVPYIPLQSGQNQLSDKNPVNYNPENSAFVPYQKLATVCKPGDSYVQDRTSMDPIYANNIQGHLGNVPSGFENGHQYNEKANRLVPIYAESFSPGLKSQKTGNSLYGRDPQNSFTAHKGKESSGNEISPNGTVVSHKPFQNSGNNVYADQFRNTKTKLPSSFQGNQSLPHSQQIGGETYMNTPTIQDIRANNYENVNDLRNSAQKLPNYAPGKYSTYSDTQSPIRNPKSFRDLAFSTYDPNIINTKELEGGENGFKFGHYRQPGSYSETGQSISKEAPKNSNGFRPIQGGLRNDEQNSNKLYSPKLGYQKSDADLVPKNIENELLDRNIEPFQQNQYHNEDSFKYGDPNSDKQYVPENRLGYPKGELEPYNIGTQDLHVNTPDENTLENDKYSYTADPHMSDEEYSKMPYSGIPNKSMGNYGPGPNESNNFNNPNKPGKTLTEMYPAKLSLDEDFLHPNQVNVGLIHDITYPEIKAATHGTNDFYEDYSPDCIKEILNNIKLPDCHYCKKPFEENEFAVTIERANVLFHAGCFKCAGCNQILADNVYFFNKETDNIYCLRDYAKIRGFPRCKACDELIFTKEYCLAENSTFHLKHFCCIECDKPLAGQDYTLEEEMPYCLPCFEQSKANKCSSCCNIIKPDEVGCNLNGVHFHAVNECFACIVCKKPLMGKKLLLRNEKLYCSHECYGTEK